MTESHRQTGRRDRRHSPSILRALSDRIDHVETAQVEEVSPGPVQVYGDYIKRAPKPGLPGTRQVGQSAQPRPPGSTACRPRWKQETPVTNAMAYDVPAQERPSRAPSPQGRLLKVTAVHRHNARPQHHGQRTQVAKIGAVPRPGATVEADPAYLDDIGQRMAIRQDVRGLERRPANRSSPLTVQSVGIGPPPKPSRRVPQE